MTARPEKPEKAGKAERRDAAAAGEQPEGRFSYEGLDRVIHEKARLGILTSLVSHPQGLLFNDLKQLCALTDGNLSRHLQVLSDAGLIEVWKGYSQNRPQSMYRLSAAGRARFLEYISVLEGIVADAESAPRRPQTDDGNWAQGFSPA